MAIVTFWGNGKEETGQTYSVIAIATSMAIEHNYKILLVSTDFDDNTLEGCYWEVDKIEAKLAGITQNKTDVSTGIEGLAKAVLSNKTSPEIITNYTRIVFKDRLEVLPGIKTKDYEEYKKIKPIYSDILQLANKYYDLILVDLNKGIDDEFNREILNMSDLVVVNLTQRMKTINDFIELRGKNKAFEATNVMTILGKYDRFSKYSGKNTARYIGLKKELCTVPYNTLYFEACNEGKAADYFIRFRKIDDETDRNATFIYKKKKTVERIIYKLQELQMKM